MTFTHVRVDLGKYVFASGQAYVALSRAKTIKGMTLIRPIRMQDVKVHPRVLDYFKKSRSHSGLKKVA